MRTAAPASEAPSAATAVTDRRDVTSEEEAAAVVQRLFKRNRSSITNLMRDKVDVVKTMNKVINTMQYKAKEVRVRVTIPRVQEIEMQSHRFTAELKLEAMWFDVDAQWADIKDFLAVVYPSDDFPFKRIEGADWFKRPITSQYFELDPDRFARLLELHKRFFEAHPNFEKLKKLPDKLRDHRFFAPRLVLSNMVLPVAGSTEQWYSLRKVEGEFMVAFNWFVTGVFQHTFELSDFPFDEQDLLIELRTGYEDSHRSTPVKLVRNQSVNSLVVTRGFAQMSEYHLYQHVQFLSDKTGSAESASGARYSTLSMKVHIRRKYGYWLWNVLLPMAIVTITLFSTFALPYEETNDRLASSLTILLAMVAFKTFTAEKLPKIAYLSFIDKCAAADHAIMPPARSRRALAPPARAARPDGSPGCLQPASPPDGTPLDRARAGTCCHPSSSR